MTRTNKRQFTKGKRGMQAKRDAYYKRFRNGNNPHNKARTNA